MPEIVIVRFAQNSLRGAGRIIRRQVKHGVEWLLVEPLPGSALPFEKWVEATCAKPLVN